jgi:membrane protease YdiL (CAAX protease family)
MNKIFPPYDPDDGLSRGQTIFLWIYLAVHAAVLPLALGLLSPYLPAWLTASYLNLLYYAFGAVLIFAVTWRFFRRGFDRLCDHPAACIYAVLLGYFVMMGLMYLISVSMQLLPDSMSTDNLNNDYVSNLAGSDYGVIFAMSVFLAPMVEEPLFRGGVFGSIRRRSRAWAYIVSVGLFALYHVWQYAAAYSDPLYLLMAVEYIPAGLALCWAYERTGSIWTPMFLHALVNWMSLLSLSMTS